MKRDDLYSKPDLKVRGWTPALMRDHLPEPDDTRANPFYKSGAEMKLWRKSTVHKIEQRKAVKEAMTKAKKRREAGLEGSAKAETTREREAKEDLQVAFDAAMNEGLLDARPNMAEVKDALEDSVHYKPPTPRNLVNCIRHEFTDYDYHAQFLYGDLLGEYRAAVLNSIARHCPSLREECQRQKREWLPSKTPAGARRSTVRAKQAGVWATDEERVRA